MPLRVGLVHSPLGVETLGFGCTARRTRSCSLSRPLPATSTQLRAEVASYMLSDSLYALISPGWNKHD